MQDEYDFSGAERGKFYRPGAVFIYPVHVDVDIRERFSRLADKTGRTASELANEVLRRAFAEIDAGGGNDANRP
jgi:hypothetical protein